MEAVISALIGLTQFIWAVPLVILMLFGVRMYKITNVTYMIKIQTLLKDNAVVSLNGNNPDGIFAGRWFIGYAGDSRVTLISSRAKFIELTGYSEEPTMLPQLGVPSPKIPLYTRQGSYEDTYYHRRVLVAEKFTPRPHQAPVVAKIADIYAAKSTAAVLLYGPPGSGKSMIAVLLAKELHGGVCTMFNPTMPGVELSYLYNRATPSAAEPLIVVIDEVDVLFEQIHTARVRENPTTPTAVRNKSDWNRLLDDISIGLYPNIVLILTSNMTPAAIKSKYDPAYIRAGRVDETIEIM